MEKASNFGHLDLIRRINRSLVLNTIKAQQPISRAQVAKRLNLSKATVSTIVDELIQKKMIVECGEFSRPGEVGRPSTMLGFNPKSAFCIGLDIGGTKLLAVITDLAGEIVYETKVPTSNQVDDLVSLVENSISACGLTVEKVFGMGVGVPGTVRPDGLVVRAKTLQWNNFPLQQILNERFPFPVFVGNDVNLAALGERWLGSGGQVDNMIFIALGTGIGGALVFNGQLVLGAQGRAGELGYFLERRDLERGVYNRLGSLGVLERKCSGTALGSHGYGTEELFKAYRRGETAVNGIIEEFIQDFSVAIANCISLMNPSKVVIGGGVSDSMDVVIQRIREEVAQLTPLQADVCLASLGVRAGALGAINYASTQIEQLDIQVKR